MFTRTTHLVVACILATTAIAQAADSYYDIPIRDLKLVEGTLPVTTDQITWRHYDRGQSMQPYAILDGPGEAYLSGPRNPTASNTPPAGVSKWKAPASATSLNLHVRAPEKSGGQRGQAGARQIRPFGHGRAAKFDDSRLGGESPEAKVPFIDAKLAHYDHLVARDIPGGAWFRHQGRVVGAEINRAPAAVQQRFVPQVNRQDELTRSYDLFTGGRAISENLQLDRVMPQRVGNETPVKVDSIAGITIKEIDWTALIKDGATALDPLARTIPFDQHAVFFPSFQAALTVADETKQHDTPVLRLAEPRAEDAGVVARYERQLGLPMSTLARMLGPTLVKSVALTGSDPSFPLGTDVAILLESEQPALLEKALRVRIAMAAAEMKNVDEREGLIDIRTAYTRILKDGVEQARLPGKSLAKLAYDSFVSPDRKMSSYIARLDNAVVVTNSLHQLEHLNDVRSGDAKSLADLPEYKFFRARYSRKDMLESAFIFISDATIRRWCGPKWRIADARRTRARAVLAELQASQLDALVKQKVQPGPIHTDLPILGGGEIQLTPGGVVSSVYGTLDFMTPIGEMPLDEVTQDEAQGYGFWRDGYQRNWSWGFDPIGLRISLSKRTLAADLTILPLILNSGYDNWVEVPSRAAPGVRAPPPAIPTNRSVQFVMALNKQSRLFQQRRRFRRTMAVSGPSWIEDFARLGRAFHFRLCRR